MKAGDKVVCVNAEGSPFGRIIKDKIYTLSNIIRCPNGLAVQLKEIGHMEDAEYIGYLIDRFRKIEPSFTNAITKELAEDFLEHDKQTEIEKHEEPTRVIKDKTQRNLKRVC